MQFTNSVLIPAAYDLVWVVALVAVFAIVVTALVSISRQRAAMTGSTKLAWALLVIFVPILGVIAWFTVGRPIVIRERATSSRA